MLQFSHVLPFFSPLWIEGIDPSGKKFDTLCQRLQCKIKDADGLSQGRRKCVLPILIRDVFVQVLSERGVPLVQCPFEADREIACLAHQWNCPVLTNDSDFFIFDLPGGGVGVPNTNKKVHFHVFILHPRLQNPHVIKYL